MDPSQIKDRKSVKAWLEAQTQEVAVAIAHRSAMRVAPLFWREVEPVSSRLNLTALANLRCLLISGVASTCPTPEIKAAASDAAAYASAASDADASDPSDARASDACAAAYAAAYAYAAASDARASVGNATTSDAAYVDYAAGAYASASDASAIAYARGSDAYAAAYAASGAYAAASADAAALAEQSSGQAVIATPLWPAADNPLSDDWLRVRAGWADAGEGWNFWIDWYDAALEGRPLLGDWDRHWALLTEIALIENEVWDTGPDEVNTKVAGIVETHRALAEVIDKTPNGEEIALDPVTGQLMSIPLPGIRGKMRDHIVQSIRTGIERFETACSGSGSSNFGPVLRDCAKDDLGNLLEDVIDCGSYDLRLHDVIEDCLGSLRHRFEEQGLASDPAANRLTRMLERCTIDIYANSDAAREVLEKRAEEYYRRISLEHLVQLNQLAQDMAADSVEALRRQMLEDVVQADDETADPELRRRSRYRTISRLPRGARAIRYSRFEGGRRILDDTPKSVGDRKKLWIETVLGPIGAALISGLLQK